MKTISTIKSVPSTKGYKPKVGDLVEDAHGVHMVTEVYSWSIYAIVLYQKEVDYSIGTCFKENMSNSELRPFKGEITLKSVEE